MANVEHSSLTGAALHEPKGIAAAAANRVYVSDGLGSGSWTQLSGATLTGTANPFGAQLLHVKDQRTNGTAAQTLTNTGTWQKRDLQTTPTNEISGASLSSSVISLPAGTYHCEADTAVHYSIVSSGEGAAKVRLRNTSGSTDLLTGHSSYIATTTSFNSTNTLILTGRFTLGSTSNVELQIWTSGISGNCTFTGGKAASASATETFSNVRIWKVL